MKINPQTGLLDVARQVNSPNFDERPENTPIDLLVIHNISLPPSQFGGPWIDNLFTNCLDPQAHPYFKEIHEMKVSAHVLIRRDGEIVQYVPFHKRAWHAGQSNYCGRDRCNNFSIGIELEGSDDKPFEQCQYEQLAVLIKTLTETYPDISTDHLVGHSDIAPARKTDPGPHFDWQKLRSLIA